MKLESYFRAEQGTAMAWCIRNGFTVWCNLIGKDEYTITVDNRGVQTTSEETYSKKKVFTKIYEIYCYMYDVNL